MIYITCYCKSIIFHFLSTFILYNVKVYTVLCTAYLVEFELKKLKKNTLKK